MNNKLKEEKFDYLMDAVLALETKEECYNFFEDLCTIPELKAMAQRLHVAKMLSENRVYSDIVAETGASTATISRVNRSLIYGCDGYGVVFERLREVERLREIERLKEAEMLEGLEEPAQAEGPAEE